MTAFDALLDSVPSGLHDAELTALRIDYARAEVTCDVLVNLSSPDDGGPDPNDRPARITFAGVTSVVVDSPTDGGETLGPSRIDAGSGHPATDPHPGVTAPDDGFRPVRPGAPASSS
jgi:hypothetical protein